jgi:hypothetical protein
MNRERNELAAEPGRFLPAAATAANFSSVKP